MKNKITDEERGYKDRLAGFYDKWYRYNRLDDGAAYDVGCVKAIDSEKCPEHFVLIGVTEVIRSDAGRIPLSCLASIVSIALMISWIVSGMF